MSQRLKTAVHVTPLSRVVEFVGGHGEPRNLVDFATASRRISANPPTEFSKIFSGKLWFLIIRWKAAILHILLLESSFNIRLQSPVYMLKAAVHLLLLQLRSFINQLKKLQAMVGMPSGATGIMQRVTARQVQTGTCIMVCQLCTYLPCVKARCEFIAHASSKCVA